MAELVIYIILFAIAAFFVYDEIKIKVETKKLQQLQAGKKSPFRTKEGIPKHK